MYNCYSQKKYKTDVKNNTGFINEYLNHFDQCSLPFYTQKIDLSYNNLISKYKRIPKNFTLNYIGNSKDDIGVNYSNEGPETGEIVEGYVEFDYYYLCKYNRNNILLALYIKDCS